MNLCSNITKITILNDSIALGIGSLMGCEKLSSIYGIEKVNYICDVALFGTELVEKELETSDFVVVKDTLVAASSRLSGDIILPEVKYVSGNLFMQNNNITSIKIPDTVISVGTMLCFQCDKLESIILSKNIQEIPTNLIYYCDNAREITLPDNLRAIYGLTVVENTAYDLVIDFKYKNETYSTRADDEESELKSILESNGVDVINSLFIDYNY